MAKAVVTADLKSKRHRTTLPLLAVCCIPKWPRVRKAARLVSPLGGLRLVVITPDASLDAISPPVRAEQREMLKCGSAQRITRRRPVRGRTRRQKLVQLRPLLMALPKVDRSRPCYQLSAVSSRPDTAIKATALPVTQRPITPVTLKAIKPTIPIGRLCIPYHTECYSSLFL